MYVHQDKAFYLPNGEEQQPAGRGLRQSAVKAIANLKAKNPSAAEEVDFDDQFGYARLIPQDHLQGVVTARFRGNARQHANILLQHADIRAALGLDFVELRSSTVERFSRLGYRVGYKQVMTVAGRKRPVRVRGGFVHVFMDNNGIIFRVNSSLRFGQQPKKLAGLLKPRQVAKAAVETHAKFLADEILGAGVDDPARRDQIRKQVVTSCLRTRSELVLSSHDDEFSPMYEVTVSTCKPDKRAWSYLVHATSGGVVYGRNLQYRAAGIPVRRFLSSPDPDKALDGQIYDHVIASLPDPKKLANDRFVMKVKKNGRWVDVKAADDGSFKFAKDTVEFAAVQVFCVLNEQDDFYESLGASKAKDTFTVFVHDDDVTDNAYEDWQNKEIHTGKGSGVDAGGLTVWISYDPQVTNHESGHRWVGILTVDHDLGGREGAGAHEGWAGDMFGAQAMEYWRRRKYSKELGAELTADDVKADPFYVGRFSMPPKGIRQQDNNKQYPSDMTGEPHADGEVIGGAGGSLAKAIIADAKLGVDEGLARFTSILLHSLILAPAHKVTFRDLLRGCITADKQLYGGAGVKVIEAAFKKHGITQGSKAEPVNLGGLLGGMKNV